ncbi:helix-turn-helix domain-containing protein [Phenylobacterium sp. LjRoot219]|uniref:helix-turn-helix domain-containing protein n=1 Tax=Phenylobacterium sp. LjRoot219 TaxID=3342283 RepID=UPI003ECFAE22
MTGKEISGGSLEPPGAAGEVAPETTRLLAAAAEIAALSPAEADRPTAQAEIATFTRRYREWILRERGMADAPERWAELGRLLLHSMVGAATLNEAVQIIARFAHTLYGDRLHAELQDEGGATARLVFQEPLRAGAEGLISAIWPLTFTLCQLEFLVGGPLQGVTGRVRHAPCLPDDVAELLFSPPLAYRSAETALVIPKRELSRAVVARAAEIPQFFGQVMRATLALGRPQTDTRSVVAHLLRNDRLRDATTAADLPQVAARLGCSPATLRRRLTAEGASFRALKDEVFDALAKGWLSEPQLTIEQIAERLGYSDSFAFRRAFRRRNGEAPLAYRRRVLADIS